MLPYSLLQAELGILTASVSLTVLYLPQIRVIRTEKSIPIDKNKPIKRDDLMISFRSGE